MEHVTPDEADHDRRDHHRQDEQRAQHRHATDVAIEQQGQADAQQHFNADDGESENQRHPKTRSERRIVQKPRIVRQPDEFGLADALAGVPVAKAAPDHVDDRIEQREHHHERRGRDEHVRR